MPKELSGTPASPDSAAPESPKAARCSTRSRRIVAASRACSAATTAAPCTSWPTATAKAAPPTVSCSSTPSRYRTRGDPENEFGREERAMPKVIADITMSLDGYVTGPGADLQHGLG